MKPFEIGLMLWANDAEQKIQILKSLGIGIAQIGVRWSDINQAHKRRTLSKLLRHSGIEWVTLFAAFDGESYADIPAVQNTVGLVPAATRASRTEEAKRLTEFACEIGIKNFAFHVGMVPDNPDHPDYPAVVRAVRAVADEARFNGQQLCLETGQEAADTLLGFIADLKTTNIKVNFDPANLILYGSDHPMDALEKLQDYVVSVHCKDGKRPSEPNRLGTETPLGVGQVGIDRFVSKLRDIGYQGPLIIEREISGDQQIFDVKLAIQLLKSLGGVAAAEPAVEMPPAPEIAPVSDEPVAVKPEAPTQIQSPSEQPDTGNATAPQSPTE